VFWRPRFRGRKNDEEAFGRLRFGRAACGSVGAVHFNDDTEQRERRDLPAADAEYQPVAGELVRHVLLVGGGHPGERRGLDAPGRLYAGFTASNVGWTLSETVVGTSAGSAVLSGNVLLANPILIPSGGPTSIYFHAITAGGGIRYTGVAATPPQTTWTNADVTLFSDVSRTGAVPFAGTQFTPRTFAGTINYTVIPAPASLAVLGLGGLVAARRRR
jgi:hypothetical protein